MKKNEKTFFVENLAEELKSAKSIILVDYSGLSVKNQQELKKRLKETGAKMLVVKNTLLKLAGESANVSKDALSQDFLSGQTALVLAENDPVTPIKIVADFAKEFETPKLKVGIIEGSFQDKENLEKLSKLPGREVLLTQVLGSISSPVYGMVNVLNANMQKLIYILERAGERESGRA